MSIAKSCPLCGKGALRPLRVVEDVPYLRCDGCGSILAEQAFLERTMAGEARSYDAGYWAAELKAAQARGYGASLIRLAEVFIYARRPMRRFLDVSCGAGTLLDAAAELLPEIAGTFWGIEPFPPPPEYRARHPQYRVGYLHDLEGRFDGGVCIEVIEHLPPPILRAMLRELATVSEPDALWYFNSAQPDFVLRDDPGYLDPYTRGHIASYSVEGLRPLFAEAGFTLHALPGREWAFLAEFGQHGPEDTNTLLDRIWHVLPENRDALCSARFGELLFASGREGARCYLEAATAAWAVGENRELAATSQALRETISERAAAERAMAAELRLALRQRQELEEQLAVVFSSTSWRMTGPLRRVTRLLRGERIPAQASAPAVPDAAPVGHAPLVRGPELIAHLSSQAEWQAWSQRHAADLSPAAAQRIVSQVLSSGLTIPLFGAIGASEVVLEGREARESLSAGGTNSRLRAVLLALSWCERAHDVADARIYMHEALTPFAPLMRGRYLRLIGSEYAPDEAGAAALWPVPAVDIMRSPFPDAVFDFVVTNEVLEHVPDLMAALRDTCRILRPGGWLVGTFPFDWNKAKTEIRARLTDEGIEHLHPPEYHGNPVDPEGGSLVFQIPGWDVLEMCREAGFAKAEIVFIGSGRYGITSTDIAGCFVLMAQR